MAERLNMVDGSMAQRLDGLADPWLSGLTGQWLDGLSVGVLWPEKIGCASALSGFPLRFVK
jgi:hypothetical protein